MSPITKISDLAESKISKVSGIINKLNFFLFRLELFFLNRCLILLDWWSVSSKIKKKEISIKFEEDLIEKYKLVLNLNFHNR